MMSNINREIKCSNKSRVHICLADHPEKWVEINKIINKVKGEFKAITYSRIKYKKSKTEKGIKIICDSAYIGYWFDKDKNKYIRDDIHLIFVDIDTSKYPNYLQFFFKLQHEIRNIFKEKEAWVTVSNVSRIY